MLLEFLVCLYSWQILQWKSTGKVLENLNVELLAITPNSEQIIAQAYGICTGKETIQLASIQKWINAGHLSPVEHASATFLISGISRACMSQLTRHRLASFSVRSMRYTDSKLQPFVMPETIASDYYLKIKTIGLVRKAQELYAKMQEHNIPNEDARFVLPIATTTNLIMSANFREWRHVFELRCSKHAQWEIRELCMKMLEILYDECPNVFCDLCLSADTDKGRNELA